MTTSRGAAGAETCDVLILADFTRSGDRAFRLAQEIRAHHANGLRVGLIQHRQPGAQDVISPAVQACVRRGLALALDPALPHQAPLVVVHEPSRAEITLPAPSGPGCEVIHVCHDASDYSGPTAFGANIRCIAVNPFIAPRLRARKAFDDYWLPLLPALEPKKPRSLRGLAVGWLGDVQVPGPTAEHIQIASGAGGMAGPASELSLDRLIAGLDVIVLPDVSFGFELPDTLIAFALAAGLQVVLPRSLLPHYGAGPHYFRPKELQAKVTVALATAGSRHDLPTPPPDFVRRCRAAGAALRPARPLRPTRPQPAKPRPTLCLSANGVGVGHLTRLLAIARRMEGEVIFASQVPALEILGNYGYRGEYIPSAATVGADFATWDAWFGAHLTRLLDRYDPTMVVYDGNHPSWGLIGTVGARSDCRLAWIRRGMWANTTSAHLANARWCDLVIEPGELAGALDQGVTSALRHEAIQVDPIRLLDEDDLLDRASAAARLGLDPRRPAVLIQLGSGFNRDLLSLLDQVITTLSRTSGLQIALAEWVNGTIPLSLWPQVRVLRGFPISQYIRAFDFCISAAGYNSFHELLGFAVPTIFLANRHPTMDDQYARAKFAQDKAAAFEISEQDLSDLPDLIALLTQDRPRAFLAQNCRGLSRANGAIAAAAHLQDLAGKSLRTLP